MNARQRLIAALLLLAILVCGFVWARSRLAEGRARLQAAETYAQEVAEQLAAIGRMRAAEQQVARQRRPDADLVARAQRALADAGLPVDRLAGVQPRGDEQLGEAGYAIQRVVLQLQELEPGQMGGWVRAWRGQQPQPWTIEELQATRPDRARRNASQEEGNHYRWSLVLAAPYWED